MGHSEHPVLSPREQLLSSYQLIRNESESICAPLLIEDYVIQTMPDVSPPKWHLAHTSWFFETFILAAYVTDYRPYHPQYDYLFNSYYVTHGTPYPRPQRGLLSRPGVDEIYAYRNWVNDGIKTLIQTIDDENLFPLQKLITLGLNHEQQHQELLLTDIKHILAHNPLKPAYLKLNPAINDTVSQSTEISWINYDGGLVEIGCQDDANFSYDNEGPRHQTFTNGYKLASRLINNAEYQAFIDDGGYQQPEHWFSDAWATVQSENWQAPLYWEKRDKEWWHFTLQGLLPVDPNAPVCHVSQYEADAFARWSGKRLPSETEWEVAASQYAIDGNLREQGCLKPRAVADNKDMNQLFGDVWEWTASPYTAYPGYQPGEGAIGEYNGKFMSGQIVLRGGSFATPSDHIRASYRNFFYPQNRWQFSGIRLADDL